MPRRYVKSLAKRVFQRVLFKKKDLKSLIIQKAKIIASRRNNHSQLARKDLKRG